MYFGSLTTLTLPVGKPVLGMMRCERPTYRCFTVPQSEVSGDFVPSTVEHLANRVPGWATTNFSDPHFPSRMYWAMDFTSNVASGGPSKSRDEMKSATSFAGMSFQC